MVELMLRMELSVLPFHSLGRGDGFTWGGGQPIEKDLKKNVYVHVWCCTIILYPEFIYICVIRNTTMSLVQEPSFHVL